LIQVIAEVNIEGSHRKPTFNDLLVVQLVFLPYSLFLMAKKYHRRNLSGVQLTDDEKEEMAIERVGGRLWDSLEEVEQKELLKKEIWKNSVYIEWIAAKEREEEELSKKMGKKSRRDNAYDSDEEY
jgi:hypothetical protein